MEGNIPKTNKKPAFNILPLGQNVFPDVRTRLKACPYLKAYSYFLHIEVLLYVFPDSYREVNKPYCTLLRISADPKKL
jgi:hypothetical protein